MSRLEQLLKLAAVSPEDPLAHYALGLEFINLGRWNDAVGAFERTLQVDARYSAAYYHKARAEIKGGHHEAARATLRTGIPLADAAGDLKTVKEMRQLLDTIS